MAVSLQGIDSARPLWEVIQAHNLRDYNKGCDGCRTPSASEERSMAWQAVCRGANGVVCCSWGGRNACVDAVGRGGAEPRTHACLRSMRTDTAHVTSARTLALLSASKLASALGHAPRFPLRVLDGSLRAI